MKHSVDVNDYMVKRPVLVTPETELFEAIHQILRHKLSGVTVVDGDKTPIGMLSELDCLRAILSGTYYGDEIVAQSMLDHKHRRRPVVNDNNEVVGQLSCRAILKCIKDFDVPKRWFEGR